MPPLNLRQIDEELEGLEITFAEEQQFEDIRRYGITGNVSSPAISSRLSQNVSSPSISETLSTNTSSPAVTGQISTNTSSPSISNLDLLGPIYDEDDEMYEDEYSEAYGEIEEEYDYSNIIGELSLGLNEEAEWEIQALTISNQLEEDEAEIAIESVKEILEQLETNKPHN